MVVVVVDVAFLCHTRSILCCLGGFDLCSNLPDWVSYYIFSSTTYKYDMVFYGGR